MLAHKVALEVIPTADIDIVPFDADEIKALALSEELAGARQGEDVLADPDQRPDLTARESTLLSQFARQGIGGGLSGADAASRGDPEMARTDFVPKGLEEQHTVVTI
jgi:hypothetical protein